MLPKEALKDKREKTSIRLQNKQAPAASQKGQGKQITRGDFISEVHKGTPVLLKITFAIIMKRFFTRAIKKRNRENH